MMNPDTAAGASVRHAVAADSLKRYSYAARFATGLEGKDLGVRVSWTWGASITGYKELSDEVTRIVGQRIDSLIAEAIQNLAEAAQVNAHVAVREHARLP